jgi:hypothetical protein
MLLIGDDGVEYKRMYSRCAGQCHCRGTVKMAAVDDCRLWTEHEVESSGPHKTEEISMKSHIIRTISAYRTSPCFKCIPSASKYSFPVLKVSQVRGKAWVEKRSPRWSFLSLSGWGRIMTHHFDPVMMVETVASPTSSMCGILIVPRVAASPQMRSSSSSRSLMKPSTL